jgi:tRNA(Ile)-lysidine synthase
VIRPLLEVSRADIEAYVKSEKIEHVTDTTNAELNYTRNRIRHVLLPEITKKINPHAARLIARNAAVLRADEAFLEAKAREAYKSVKESPQCFCCGIILQIPLFLALPEALQSRVVRMAICQARQIIGENEVMDYTDIHAVHIADTINIAQGATGRELHLSHITVRREYERLHFFSNKEKENNPFFYHLTPDIPLFVPEIGKTFLFSLSPPEENIHQPLYCTRKFNYDMLSPHVHAFCVRTRQAGDKIGRTKKLQDYFINNKIPRSVRGKIALAAVGSHVLWVMDDRNQLHSRYAAVQQGDTLCYISYY